MWHWTFLAQPAPLPEELIAKARSHSGMEDGELDQGEIARPSIRVRSSTTERVFRSPAHPCPMRRLSRRPHADLANDEADRAAGKTIDLPVVGLVGRRRHAKRNRRPARDLAAVGAGRARLSRSTAAISSPRKIRCHRCGADRIFHRYVTVRTLRMHPVLRLYEDVLSAPKMLRSACRRSRALSSWCTALPRSAAKS